MDIFNYKRTKHACYYTTLAMSTVFSLPPLLFATFRELYGISYTLLGTLVLITFCTQFGIDLIFCFFSKHFNTHKTVRLMPLITATGLLIYALIPTLLPQYAYIGLVIGTVLFSVAAGLSEVLINPTVAALPSKTPEKDMSILHSLYGYGVVGVVLISTLFLNFVGKQYWMYLAFFWAILPVIASVLLCTSKLPDMNMTHSKAKSVKSKHRTKGIILCMACIFCGSCVELTMSNWISVYTENVLQMPKMLGDIFGMSLFAVLLALTRTAYAKFGKNILRVLMMSMLGAAMCYALVAFSSNAVLSLLGCVSVGICSSMLWPGTLILMEENVPAVGVSTYALMAAGGDFGASFAPQVLGIIVDKISVTDWAQTLGNNLALSSEQIGFKVGMLIATFFPILGFILLVYIKNFFKINLNTKNDIIRNH